MSKHLYVKQTTLDNTIENNVQSTVVKKLYDIIIPKSLQNTQVMCGSTSLKNITINIREWTTIPCFRSSPNIVPFVIYMPLKNTISELDLMGVNYWIGEIYGPSSWTQMYWPNVTEIYNKNYYYTGEYSRTGLFSEGRPKHTIIDLIYLKNIEKLDYAAFNYTNIKAFVIDNTTVPPIVEHERGSDTIINANQNSLAVCSVIYVSTGGWHFEPTDNYRIYVPDSVVNDYKTAWSFYADVIHGISELNGGVKYATEADWVAAGKPIALIEEYMN